jgi:4-aminobutyrate aminotransferase-like enzyme
MHTSTFLGNPVACAAAIASLEEIGRKDLPSRAAEEGGRWLEDLRGALTGHESVGDVRGRGLMIGIDLVTDRASRAPGPELAARVVVECLRRGWIVLPGGAEGNVISLSPPLTLSRDLMRRATTMLMEAIETAEAG